MDEIENVQLRILNTKRSQSTVVQNYNLLRQSLYNLTGILGYLTGYMTGITNQLSARIHVFQERDKSPAARPLPIEPPRLRIAELVGRKLPCLPWQLGQDNSWSIFKQKHKENMKHI